MELEEDGTILLSTVGQLFAGAASQPLRVRRLQYVNKASGRSRLVRLEAGKLYPPRNGWEDTVYTPLLAGLSLFRYCT